MSGLLMKKVAKFSVDFAIGFVNHALSVVEKHGGHAAPPNTPGNLGRQDALDGFLPAGTVGPFGAPASFDTTGEAGVMEAFCTQDDDLSRSFFR